MSNSLVEMTCVLLSGIGAAFLLYKLAQFALSFLRIMKTTDVCGREFPFQNYGSWAVITGATDGIGREYAMQLAAKGLNVVLISRSQSKLEEVAAAITDLHGVQAKFIVADFTRGSELYTGVRQQLAGLDIGVLVNNVGMVSPLGDFLCVPNRAQAHPAEINCNALSAVGMTYVVLPGMIAKKRGVIINISSIAGEGHCILPDGVYAATKSFVSSFSRSLHVEYSSQGIVVQNVTPGVVSTKMVKGALERISKPLSASSFVRSALHTVGTARDTCGCLRHQILLETLNCLPQPMLLRSRARLLSSMKDLQ